MDVRLPPPENWQDFESICHRLWSEIWNDFNAQKNGRLGQMQNGVDIFGKPARESQYHGIQCKDKNLQLGSFLTKTELEQEAVKATNFKPEIKSFTIATTAPRDESIQEHSRNLSENRIFPFDVNVWSWDDIKAEISYRPLILKQYYPLFNEFVDNSTSIKFNRFSTEDHLNAFFSRPGLNEKFSEYFVGYLRPLICELADNAYTHGKATEFKIEINGDNIELKFNGMQHNPIAVLDSYSFICSGSKMGSFVLRTFINDLGNSINVNYSIDDGINVLKIEVNQDLLNIKTTDYYELTIRSEMRYGRVDAVYTARNLPLDKKDIIVNVTEPLALSVLDGFITEALMVLRANQTLHISLPRHGYFEDIEKWYNDERLKIVKR